MVDKDTASFMRSLCMGQIEEDIILPFPEVPEAERETLVGVISSLEQLLGPRENDFRKWDRKGEFPPEFVEELLGRSGFAAVHHVGYRQTRSPYPGIVELDNRERESLFVEARR